MNNNAAVKDNAHQSTSPKRRARTQKAFELRASVPRLGAV